MNVIQSLTELYNSQDIDSIYRELALKILGNLNQMRRITMPFSQRQEVIPCK